jgi:hypothetical protein
MKSPTPRETLRWPICVVEADGHWAGIPPLNSNSQPVFVAPVYPLRAKSRKKVAHGSIALTRAPAIACVASATGVPLFSRRGVSGTPRVSNNKIRKTTGQTNPPVSRNRSLARQVGRISRPSTVTSRLIHFACELRIFKICCRSHSRHDSNAPRDVQPRPPQLLQEAYPRAERCTKQLGQ